MSHASPPPMILAVGDLIDEIAVRLVAPWRRGSDATARITRRRGGSAANVAVAAVAAGGRARFLGAIGEDSTGSALLAALQAAGVEAHLQRSGRSPSIIVVVEPDGERTMLPDRGVAMNLVHPGHTIFDGVSWLHAPAYSLFGEPLARTTRQLFADARQRGIPASLDASSIGALAAWGPEESRRQFAELGATCLFANAEETEYLDLRNRPLQGVTCILKRGSDEAEVRGEDGELLATAAPDTLPLGVDTTGAGDAFAGGFLVARASDAPWEDALYAGHVAARKHLLQQQHHEEAE